MKKLLHYTDEYSLWRILDTGKFFVNFNATESAHYDWGLNFVSIRGKLKNYGIDDKKCKLICEWNGYCSETLPYHCVSKVPQTLYDYDYPSNNDARYLLSIGSEPLVTHFEFDDMQKLFESWLGYQVRYGKLFWRVICTYPTLSRLFKKKLKKKMYVRLREFQNLCSERKLKIIVLHEFYEI